MSHTVTIKGQVTIPKPVRDILGITAGSKVDFTMAEDGRVVLTKAKTTKPPSRFESLRGRAGPGPSTEDILALTRG